MQQLTVTINAHRDTSAAKLDDEATRFSTPTLDTSLLKPSGHVLSKLPSYNGSGIEAYNDWEIALDSYLEGRRMCNKRKIKIVVSYLSDCALTWWERTCTFRSSQKLGMI